ncbi:hypothetical protein L2E82_32791 [Cichorium intybus]|uniref:Uncharacterized protein n=1 Tax=Cichorium intybus TaxID=13427 RepID=A0ACB9BIW2_CICIN|nr:hypothetical protein L2E82_32791 [Cichorium intybus]
MHPPSQHPLNTLDTLRLSNKYDLSTKVECLVPKILPIFLIMVATNWLLYLSPIYSCPKPVPPQCKTRKTEAQPSTISRLLNAKRTRRETNSGKSDTARHTETTTTTTTTTSSHRDFTAVLQRNFTNQRIEFFKVSYI